MDNTAANLSLLQPRILVIWVSFDSPNQHVNVINASSCAKAISVPISACVLSPKDSNLLIHCANTKGGRYIKVGSKFEHPNLLYQHLIV
jgi:hypothetical protein